MHRKSLVLSCYALLFNVASLEPRRNSTNDDITIQYNNSYIKFMENQDIETKRQYNLRKNITEDGNETQYEIDSNFTKEDHESNDSTRYQFQNAMGNHKDNNRMAIEFDINSTNAEGESYSTSHELPNLYKDDKNNTECVNDSCIQLCCPSGERLIEEKCVEAEGNYSFPIVHMTNNSLEIQQSLDEMFQLIVRDPCQPGNHLLFNQTDDDLASNEYKFFANGSLYQSHQNKLVESTNYCLAIMHRDKYDVIICKPKKSAFPIIVTVGVTVSVPFLLATFVVYSILPELQNMHGYTLRAHVSSLFVTYVVLAVYQQTTLRQLGYTTCLILALLLTFSFSASFFWLNIMCFDIWWIFRKKTRSSQGKQRERKKFMLYALYGWGCAFILIFICVMIDYVLVVPDNFIRPEFCIRTLWFSERVARTYYFYIPVGITIICNIVLFISTALTIARHKKSTDQHLRNSENRRQDDNKQWFKMYLKLFILMGITWTMEVIAVHSWAFNNPPRYIWYPTDMINALQGVIIFIIFVWKKKIRLLLMKRLGCQKCLFWRNSTNNDCHSTSTSCSTITPSGTVSLHSINSYEQTNCPAKNSSNEINQ